MSYSLDYLKGGFIEGTSIGVSKGDIRNLDYGSFRGVLKGLFRGILGAA